jgi:protein-disulfide isomerase
MGATVRKTPDPAYLCRVKTTPTLALALALLPGQDPLAARAKGAAGAPVTVYEMADFQCPACRGFALTVLPVLDREFVATGKVRWVFINLPLTQIHKNATAASEAAMCTARQGRFWAMHDLLFQHQLEWAPLAEPGPALLALGVRAGADRAKLQACVATRATRAEVEEDARLAARSGARATPSFYIEGGLLEGAPGAPQPFRTLLDSIYRARATPAR